MASVSVVVPVYRVEKYLHRCVDSVLDQTYADWELVLVDDGSPDDCGSICDAYARKDCRIQVIHRENGGLSAARNSALDYLAENSNSRWVYFLDSDDWLHPDTLSVLAAAADESGIPVVIGKFGMTQGEMPEVSREQYQWRRVNTQEYFCTERANAAAACGKLFPRECFANLRFPVGKLHEDEFTTYKILFRWEQTAVVDAPLYAYFQNPESITNSAWNPRRLDKAQALLERADWFQEKGNTAMYRQSLFACFYFLTVQEGFARKAPEEIRREYLPQIRREIQTLRKRICREIPLKNRKDLYYYILNWKLPGLMAFYRKMK